MGALQRWCLHTDAQGNFDCGEHFLASSPNSPLKMCPRHRVRLSPAELDALTDAQIREGLKEALSND